MSPWFGYPPLYAQGKIYKPGQKSKFDVILISGDAYVDHPSFPSAVVVRRLEDLGLRVAVIAQPDWRSVSDFQVFGRPELFFAVSSGAMDSMVSNYPSLRMPRREDRLSPGGKSGLRPKRAAQVYCQRLREAFPGVPIVLGGIEASLRRFSHFDFWENRIRDSIMIDSGAFLLVYGMAEAVLQDVVEWFKNHCGNLEKEIPRIPQTCIRVPHGFLYDDSKAQIAELNGIRTLPTADDCRNDPTAFMNLSKILDGSVNNKSSILVQPHPKGDVVCFPPALAHLEKESELISNQNFNRRAHPLYEERIPGLEPVQFSIISHRGCVGACSFCSLALHQGRQIRSRSEEAILAEASTFPSHPDFKGTIPDVGGPSVNMYGWECVNRNCTLQCCTNMKICPNLKGNLSPLASLLRKISGIDGVKHVFIGSGLRFDLIQPSDWPDLEYIVRNHVSGQLKVAPEHIDPGVLRLMRKGERGNFEEFVKRFIREFQESPTKRFLVPYFMTAFPGSGSRDLLIKDFVEKYKLAHKQIQDFTPTPGTLASAMFHTGLDLDGENINVAKNGKDRRKGKLSIQRPRMKRGR